MFGEGDVVVCVDDLPERLGSAPPPVVRDKVYTIRAVQQISPSAHNFAVWVREVTWNVRQGADPLVLFTAAFYGIDPCDWPLSSHRFRPARETDISSLVALTKKREKELGNVS